MTWSTGRRWKIHAALGAEKEQGFRTGMIGSVFVFFMTPPHGDT